VLSVETRGRISLKAATGDAGSFTFRFHTPRVILLQDSRCIISILGKQNRPTARNRSTILWRERVRYVKADSEKEADVGNWEDPPAPICPDCISCARISVSSPIAGELEGSAPRGGSRGRRAL